MKEHIEAGNATSSTRVKSFVCPSDATILAATQLRAASYTTNQPLFVPADLTKPQLSQFSLSTGFRVSGTSNTILLAERVHQCNFPCTGPWAAGCGTFFEHYWDLMFLPLVPSTPIAGNFGVRARTDCNLEWFSSPHQGGIMVAMGDGSVRFVSQSVAGNNWSKAIDPNNAVPLGGDW